MYKKYMYLFVLFCTSLNANETVKTDKNIETEFELTQGYRRDKLSWKTSAPDINTDGSSKGRTTLHHIDTYTSRLNATLRKDGYFLKGMIGYGNIIDGKYRYQRHWYTPNRKPHEYIHDVAEISGDYTLDSTIKMGKEFSPKASWKIAPYLGYGYFEQKIHVNHFKDVLDNERFHGFSKSYRAHWYAPQIGTRLEKSLFQKVTLFGEYTFMYPVNYRARDRFFEQHAKASRSFGHVGLAGIQYKLTDNWSVKGEYELMNFHAKGGHHIHGRSLYKLDRVERISSEVRLAIDYAL